AAGVAPAGGLHQRSFVADASDATAGHGSAVAALLVGGPDRGRPRWSGLLPGAELYAADVFERREGRPVASAVAPASAINWMVENNVPVVNVSLSGEANLLVGMAAGRAAVRRSGLVAAAGHGRARP